MKRDIKAPSPSEIARRRKIGAANQIGIYETPWGFYSSSYEANAYIDLNLSNATICRMCGNPNRVITKQIYARNQLLQTLGPWVIGKTFGSIGFGFTGKAQNS